jgi:hypothetical protein
MGNYHHYLQIAGQKVHDIVTVGDYILVNGTNIAFVPNIVLLVPWISILYHLNLEFNFRTLKPTFLGPIFFYYCGQFVFKQIASSSLSPSQKVAVVIQCG